MIQGEWKLNSDINKEICFFFFLGGDIVNNDGTGSISIYGEYFEDENFIIEPDSGGLLMMANNGKV